MANGEHPLESAKLTACLLQIPVIAVDRWFGLESVDVIGEVVYNAVAGEQECCAVPGASTVELSVDELLRRARPLPPHEEMVIDDLTEAEAAAFFAAVNS